MIKRPFYVRWWKIIKHLAEKKFECVKWWFEAYKKNVFASSSMYFLLKLCWSCQFKWFVAVGHLQICFTRKFFLKNNWRRKKVFSDMKNSKKQPKYKNVLKVKFSKRFSITPIDTFGFMKMLWSISANW